MSGLEALLHRVVWTFEDLEHALVRQGSHPLAGGDAGGGGTRVEAPAPAELDVIELRATLVKGLRWWLADRAPVRATETVAGMAAWIIGHPEVLTAEDRDQLTQNLRSWQVRAYSYLGEPEDRSREVVRVADAAAILGCTVRTIQRRVPAERRPGGRVLLYDALPVCPRCELKVGAGCGCASSAHPAGVSSAQ